MSWDTYFMDMALLVASRSKDQSVKTGCVVVGPDNKVRSTGYNGFPRGVNDDVSERHERPEKYIWTEHCERNAIYNAARVGIALKGCRIYINTSKPGYPAPCAECARGVAQAGIIEVICLPPVQDDKWGKSFETAFKIYSEAGVAVRFVAPLPTQQRSGQ